MHPTIRKAILFYGLLIAGVTIAPKRVSEPPEVSFICDRQSKYSYEGIDGKRHYVPYRVINGQDVVEGDIVIGRSDGPDYFPPVVPDYVSGQRKRWGNGVAPYVVPYVIDGSAEKYEPLIEQAMTEWASRTNIIFRKLFGPQDPVDQHYVKFISGPTDNDHRVCNSNSVGVKEKPAHPGVENDEINVVQVAGCVRLTKPHWGLIGHEIGHVLGLGHEQSRSDRDSYITMLWGNIKDGPSDDIDKNRKQYCRVISNQQTSQGTLYDFDSIMHYPVNGFSKDPPDNSCEKVVSYDGRPQCLAFEPKADKLQKQEELLGRKIDIGRSDHLSVGDIKAIRTLYPDPPPVPSSSQPCVITTTTTVSVGDQTTMTTKTEDCHSSGTVNPPYPHCRLNMCPPVRISWPRPGCRSGWCRPRPPLCGDWFDDDWDDRW